MFYLDRVRNSSATSAAGFPTFSPNLSYCEKASGSRLNSAFCLFMSRIKICCLFLIFPGNVLRCGTDCDSPLRKHFFIHFFCGPHSDISPSFLQIIMGKGRDSIEWNDDISLSLGGPNGDLILVVNHQQEGNHFY